MSQMGAMLIAVIKEATRKGVVTLKTSPNVGHLRKKSKFSQKQLKSVEINKK